MTTTDAVSPITISGPGGLLAIVPTMLGFHPSNSIVLICLAGGRRRVGPVARVDLPPGHDRALAAHLAGHAVRHADEVAIVVYQQGRRRPPLLGDLLTALARNGIAVMDAITVRGGMAYPAVGTGSLVAEGGFPVPGTDDPQMRTLTAAAALSGRRLLPDRDTLRRSIAPPTGQRRRDADRAISAVATGQLTLHSGRREPGSQRPGGLLTSGVTTDAGDRDDVPGYPGLDVLALADAALAQAETSAGVEVDVAAALAVGLTDALLRDAVLARAVTELDRPWLPALISCATWTPPFMAASLCAALAVVAYRHGDGALAQVALDRCLEAEPEHSLGHLMMAMIAAGVRPEVLDNFASPLPDDLEWPELY